MILNTDCNTVVVLYPPTPSLDCGHGLVSLSWVLSDANSLVFIDGGRENVYANGFCILPNGSVYQVCTLAI